MTLWHCSHDQRQNIKEITMPFLFPSSSPENVFPLLELICFESWGSKLCLSSKSSLDRNICSSPEQVLVYKNTLAWWRPLQVTWSIGSDLRLAFVAFPCCQWVGFSALSCQKFSSHAWWNKPVMAKVLSLNEIYSSFKNVTPFKNLVSLLYISIQVLLPKMKPWNK